MTDLEKMKAWLATYPGADLLNQFNVDYTDRIPSCGAIHPNGLVEVARKYDILGGVTITNQYNFALYYTFAKAQGDNVGAAENADWMMDFQRWVQEQSARHLAPTFGNTDTMLETIRAQNGMLYQLPEEGVATYMVQLSVTFKIYYEE